MPSNIGATEHHAFYGTGSGAAAVAVDQSGNADCTAGATWIYQTAFAEADPCTIMVAADVDIGTDPAGYLFARYSGTTRQGIRSDGNGGLQFVVSNAIAQTLSIPRGIGVYELIVHWAMGDDPLNAGQSRSMVRVWRGDTGALIDGIDWTHATPSLAGTDLIWGAQVTNGTNGTGATLTGAGYLLHETSELQVLRDRVTSAAAPTLVGDTAMEVPMPDLQTVFGEQDSAAGPTHWVAAGALEQNTLLNVGPLVNKQWEDPDAVLWSTMQADPWWTVAPDGASYLGIPWAWRRPVPKSVNKLRCRAYVRTTENSVDTNNSLTLRVWSCNRNPGVDAALPLEPYSVSATLANVNDAIGPDPGRWLEFDTLRISRTPNQRNTWLAVSAEVTGSSANTQDVEIHAVVIEPISEVDTDAIAEVGLG